MASRDQFWSVIAIQLNICTFNTFLGQFGSVKLAMYRHRTHVAVKIMKENAMEEDSFIEEAEVMT